MDDIRIYTGLLTAGEIEDLYNIEFPNNILVSVSNVIEAIKDAEIFPYT